MALYFRMFVLMVVGLFTARIVLNALGAKDRGVYETVGSFVSMMAIITSSLSTAISRFLTVEIGKGESENLSRVFATANAIMLFVSAVVLLLAEPLGIWYIGHVMNLPPGRAWAAQWVFQFSLLTFVINLLSVPYNACIIAHERMSAFAVIGIVEGVLKLLVALALLAAPVDKLVLYGGLMCLVALIVRLLYSSYSRRFFPESKAGVRMHKEYSGRMLGFAGWNGISYGAYLVNTQGVTQLINYFFGVLANTMRGLALNVENMIKQFITNVVTAINPQITKSYSSGNPDYSHELVCKGAKYAFLIAFVLSLPFFFEAETLLYLWLGDREVPDGTALFTRLGLVCMVMDIGMTTLSTYVQAVGKIKRFYVMTSIVTILIFPLTWLAYRLGFPVQTFFYIFIADYLILDALKLLMAGRWYGFPVGLFVRQTLLRILPVVLLSLIVTFLVWTLVPQGLWRLLWVLLVGTASVCLTSYFFALTGGERAFVNSKLKLISR